MSLRLITVPTELPFATQLAGEGTLEACYVVGMQEEQNTAIWHRKYRVSAFTMEVTMDVSPEIAGRVAWFFARFFTKATLEPYDGHSFVGFVAGWDETVSIKSAAHRRYDVSAQETLHLEAGRPYVARCGEVILHSMLGIHPPDTNLSVIGRQGAMVVSCANDLLRVYGADNIAEVTGHAENVR